MHKVFQKQLDKIWADLDEALTPWREMLEAEKIQDSKDALKKSYTVPDDYQPTESQAFLSMLETKRETDRILNTSKRSEYATAMNLSKDSNADSKSKSKSKSRIEDEMADEEVDRRRESLSRTYREFVDYMKTQKMEERIEELEMLGIKPLEKRSPLKLFSPVKTPTVFVPEPEFVFSEDQYEEDDFFVDTKKKFDRDVNFYDDLSYSDILDGGDIQFSDQEDISLEYDDEFGDDFEEEEAEKQKIEAQIEDIKKRVPFSDLVEDTYYPGIIDDAVNGNLNYYQVAFDMSLGAGDNPETEPDDGPPSLVEAFDMRFKLETEQRKQETLLATKNQYDDEEEELMGAAARSREDKSAESGADGQEGAVAQGGPTAQGGIGVLPSAGSGGPKTFMEFLTGNRLVNRDEVLLANAVEIDLANIVRNRPDTELIHAINSLFKADLMNNYDKSMQAAEEAYENAPPDLAETMAIHKANTFQTTELKKMRTALPSDKGKSYNPIEIISYMGVTKPVTLDADQKKRAEKEKLKSKLPEQEPPTDAAQSQAEESEDGA